VFARLHENAVRSVDVVNLGHLGGEAIFEIGCRQNRRLVYTAARRSVR
jgi:hypothetical protein